MKKIYTLLFPAVTVLLFSIAAVALENDQGQFNVITSVPRDMTYQGILKDSAGNPLPDSMVTLVLRIYDDYTAGDLEWSDAIVAVTDDGGYFTATLTMVNLPFDEDYWLEVEVEGEILTPRQKLNMVGYSARSDTSDYATAGGGWVDDGLNVRLEASYDKVGIGTSNPTNKLQVTGSEPLPILNVEQTGSHRAARFYSQNACALWVEYAGNHGLRISNTNGNGVYVQSSAADGIHVDNAGGWAGYFNGTGYFSDYVGLGTSTPQERLDVAGNIMTIGFRMPSGASDGYVLTSDGTGFGTWQAAPGGGDSDWVISDTNMYSGVTGNIGIGTPAPSEKLHVFGNIKSTGTIQSGNAIVIDGSNNRITSTYGNIDFDDENIITDGKATIGPGNFNSGQHTFVAGRNNNISGNRSTIPGGENNTAGGDQAVVGGGQYNDASGTLSAIGGGNDNDAIGTASTIGGGQNNDAQSSWTTIAGGRNNIVSYSYSTIGGGTNNSASGQSSTVGGGTFNTVTNYGGTIGGGGADTVEAVWGGVSAGYHNIAGDAYDDTAAFVGGGQNNTATNVRATVGGGEDNSASGVSSTISGGMSNTAGGDNASIGGGGSNSAGGPGATVGGGTNNSAGANYSTISGGLSNSAFGDYSAVSGGYDNSAIGNSSAIVGGQHNTAGGYFCFIGGGVSNTTNNDNSVIGGGQNNEASGNYSFIGGGQMNKTEAYFATIPGGLGDTIGPSGNYSMVFGRKVYINNSYRVALYSGSDPGRVGINRDDHDTLSIDYPLHIGTLPTNGNGAYLTNGGIWTNGSSRSFKENGHRLDGSDLLKKISNLNVESWNFIDSDERHIGPYAEEFVGAFNVGAIRESDGQREDHYLAAGDVAGVALAGVKELIEIVDELREENKELKSRIEDLESKTK